MGAISRDQELVSEAIVQEPRYDELFPRNDNREEGSDQRKRRRAVIEHQVSSDIFDNIEPIVLASQRNHFGLVQILLGRGDYIKPPHPPGCQCQSCRNLFQQNQLMSAKLRLETYKGLASDAYASLASEDPIARAFDMGKELREMASIEKHFKVMHSISVL
jgi:hypothetical protein